MNTAKRIATGAAFGLALLGMGAGTALAAPGDSPTEPIISSTPDPLNPLVPCETGQEWSVVAPAVPGVDAVTHQEFRYLKDVPAQGEVSHLTFGIQERIRDFKPGHPAVDEVSKMTYGTERRQRTYTPFEPSQYAVTHKEFKYQRTVPNGSQVETSGWLLASPGAGWTKIETRTVEDKAAVPAVPESYGPWGEWVATTGFDSQPQVPSNTSTNEYRATMPVKVVITEAQPAVPAAYGDWSGWTTTEDGLDEEPILKPDTNTREFRQLAPVKVVDKKAREGYTVYYREGMAPTKNKAKASWVEESPGKKWTQFDERTITDAEAIPEMPAVTVYYSFMNDEPCEIVVPPVVTPEPPVVDKPVPPVVKPAAPVVKPVVEIVKVVTPAPEVKQVQSAATVTDVAQPRLAQTGSEIPAIALSGLALVGVGGVMAAAAARRRKVTN